MWCLKKYKILFSNFYYYANGYIECVQYYYISSTFSLSLQHSTMFLTSFFYFLFFLPFLCFHYPFQMFISNVKSCQVPRLTNSPWILLFLSSSLPLLLCLPFRWQVATGCPRVWAWRSPSTWRVYGPSGTINMSRLLASALATLLLRQRRSWRRRRRWRRQLAQNDIWGA